VACATAAAAPASRTTSVPAHQALAVIGSGCAPQALSCARAFGSLASKRSVVCATGNGSTFSDSSQITPRMPIDPVSRRETS
jgi:hypothetical protein